VRQQRLGLGHPGVVRAVGPQDDARAPDAQLVTRTTWPRQNRLPLTNACRCELTSRMLHPAEPLQNGVQET
jgi:hypothetical protein